MSGIHVRVAQSEDAGAIAHVQGRAWQSAYLGILPNEVLLGFGEAQGRPFWERVLERSADEESVLVAEFDKDLVGFISSGPMRERIPGYSGEFYAIYVVPEAQGCGIGSALIAHAGRALVRRRWLSVAVWVLEDNRLGRQFYERLEAEPLGFAKTLAYRGNSYPAIREIAYGWTDLRQVDWLSEQPDRGQG